MFKYIENSEKILGRVGENNPFYFSDVMKIDFYVEENIFNEKRAMLNLELKIQFKKMPQVLLAKLKFHNVSDLSLNKVNTINIYDRLIISDMKEQPMDWPKEMRFHVHDDSGYGENDGYRDINFYCESIEAIGIEEFPYVDF